MIIFENQNDLKLYLKITAANKKIGFIPTMGALHEGHLALIKKSKKICDLTICSIFINPKQFNNQKDLEKYPRTIEKDISMLKKNKCDILFSPLTSDIYRDGESIKNYDFNGIDNILEGAFRPSHFNGVATIVEKLFDIVKADYAFFGLKDLQQTIIIKVLVKLKRIKTKIIEINTIREKNGLAKSSRNIHLSVDNKEKASLIFKQLSFCKNNIKTDNKSIVLNQAKKILTNNDIEIEYLELVELDCFSIKNKIQANKKYAICIAVYISGIRLIDNIIL